MKLIRAAFGYEADRRRALRVSVGAGSGRGQRDLLERLQPRETGDQLRYARTQVAKSASLIGVQVWSEVAG